MAAERGMHTRSRFATARLGPSASMASVSRRMDLACCRKIVPRVVGRTPRVERSKMRKPSICSTSCRMRLRFGWPINRFSAACEIDRVRSISIIYCKCCVFMPIPPLLFYINYNIPIFAPFCNAGALGALHKIIYPFRSFLGVFRGRSAAAAPRGTCCARPGSRPRSSRDAPVRSPARWRAPDRSSRCASGPGRRG